MNYDFENQITTDLINILSNDTNIKALDLSYKGLEKYRRR